MKDPKDLLGEARAIIFAMKSGAISYDKAKAKVDPILKEYNEKASKISNAYGRKWYNLTFTKLAR